MIFRGSRYVGSKLLFDGNNGIPYLPPPRLDIAKSNDDVMYQFQAGDRLDILANKFYGDPQAQWIILYANPEYDSPFDIVEGDILIIPKREGMNISEYGIG